MRIVTSAFFRYASFQVKLIKSKLLRILVGHDVVVEDHHDVASSINDRAFSNYHDMVMYWPRRCDILGLNLIFWC